MRCRRNKKIEPEMIFTPLTSSKEIFPGCTYLIEAGVDIAHCFYNSDEYIEFEKPVDIEVDVGANSIVVNGSAVQSPYTGVIKNVTKIACDSYQDGEISFLNEADEYCLAVSQVNYLKILKSIIVTIKSINGAGGFTPYTKYVSEIKKSEGLAFFGSYGSYESLQTIRAPLKNAIEFPLELLPQSASFIKIFSRIVKIKNHSSPSFTISSTLSPGKTILFYFFQYSPIDNELVCVGTRPIPPNRTSSVIAQLSFPYEEENVIICAFTNGSSVSDEDRQKIENVIIEYVTPVHHKIPTSDGKTFAEEQEGVACSLTQRLSIIKGELFYQINTGLPLFDKGATSTTFDAWIVQTVMSHPDVKSITSFSSYTENHSYHCGFVALTKYGEIEVSI